MEEFCIDPEIRLPSVTDRYYTKYYSLDTKGRPNEDQCVLQHSNKVCVTCVAPSHKLLHTAGVKINKIEFQIGKLDRTNNEVSGRFKSGQKLTPNSPLCFVHTDDGNKYVIYSCIKGTLLEVNESLVSDPNLLLHKPLSSGYVAIVLLKHSQDKSCLQLTTEDEYNMLRTV